MAESASETLNAPWHHLEELVERGDHQILHDEIDLLGVRETARAMARTSHETNGQILASLAPEFAAGLLEEMAPAQAADLLNNFDPVKAAAIVGAMESADAADVLRSLNEPIAEEILVHLTPEDAEEARRLSRYPAEVAGGIMITEYLAFPESWSVRQVIEAMRDGSEEYAKYTIQYTYVLREDGSLVGVLPLRDLLLTPGKTPVKNIMITNPLAVEDHEPLDELVRIFEDYSFLGVPVIEEGGKLVGVVRRNDVLEAVGERAQSDFLKVQGIVGGDELRSMPTMLRSRRRLSWLTINIGLNFISASVIGFYTDTLEQVIALAIFLPIISDMSGCAGSQAVAVTMRELTLGLIKPRDLMHVWLKEMGVGIICGVVLGLIIAGVAWIAPFGIWGGSPELGLVLGAALALNTLAAVLLGGAMPLILKLCKQDPALASVPLLTTITDMVGFFLVLSFATYMITALI